ncbi:hypothetical protein ACIGCK_14360 [Microbacterium sp. NPDC078428]|uniref:hypothetical protein n=1 Tax=Microbacterium sp. NPDC078428 TaxID=3364190 RepID=UPI0037CC6E2F
MTTNIDTQEIRASLLAGANIRRVIKIDISPAETGIVICAKVDLPRDLSMSEVSVVLHQAKRRLQPLVPEAKEIYLEPDVWIDPEAVRPTTSAIVILSSD